MALAVFGCRTVRFKNSEERSDRKREREDFDFAVCAHVNDYYCNIYNTTNTYSDDGMTEAAVVDEVFDRIALGPTTRSRYIAVRHALWVESSTFQVTGEVREKTTRTIVRDDGKTVFIFEFVSGNDQG